MRSSFYFLVGLGFLAASGGVSSQTPPATVKPAPPKTAPAAPGKPAVDPIALLKGLKTENATMLERQQTVLKALDVLGEEARQARIFAKRG